MEPFGLSLATTTVLGLIDWKQIVSGWVTEGGPTVVNGTVRGLFARVAPTEHEKLAKIAIGLFTKEFISELEATVPDAASPGYNDQLRRLIEHTAPEIADWLHPETKDIDLSPVERAWRGLNLDPLPEDFDWPHVAKNYERAIRKHIKTNPDLRDQLNTALLEQQTEFQHQSASALAQIAGPNPGFNLAAYRDFLAKKCELLQLSPLHTSAYHRRIRLWSIFVPQHARESVPVRELPHELRRRLREEGHLTSDIDDESLRRFHDAYASSPISPVLDILSRSRHTVVLGDPGSGKTSLLKSQVLSWVNPTTAASSKLPLWIDLKEYGQAPTGLLQFLHSGRPNFPLDSHQIDSLLQTGKAVLYLDGLGEIFEAQTRASVIEEIAAFAARYRLTAIVVSSRIIGYEPERLRNAGFTHATLEEFDDSQIAEFLTRWHHAAEEIADNRTLFADRLSRALRESRAVRALAGNPLLLTMIAILNRTQGLPRDRAELYAQASRVLLHEWDATHALPLDQFGRQEKEELLRELAGFMQQRQGGLAGNLVERGELTTLFRGFLKARDVTEPSTKANELVNRLIERNFTLCYAGADRFSFVHRTFLEYYCAAWFVDRFEKKQTINLNELIAEVFAPHWKDERWHEVLRLIAGMVGEKQAETLIQFLMSQDGRRDNAMNVILASACLGEVRNRTAIRATDRELRHQIQENVVRYKRTFSYEQYTAYEEETPSRLLGVAVLALVWPDATTCRWLKDLARTDDDLVVRKVAVQELARGWKDDPETLPLLKDLARSKDNFLVRQAAVHELARGWKDDPETLPLLRSHARFDSNWAVREAAVRELARGWKDDPETLSLLKDRARFYDDVRQIAVRELTRGWKNDPEVRAFLTSLPTAKHNDPSN